MRGLCRSRCTIAQYDFCTCTVQANKHLSLAGKVTGIAMGCFGAVAGRGTGRMERLSRVAQHVGGDLVSQLSELGQLFRDGLLTHDEFGTPSLPTLPPPPLR